MCCHVQHLLQAARRAMQQFSGTALCTPPLCMQGGAHDTTSQHADSTLKLDSKHESLEARSDTFREGRLLLTQESFCMQMVWPPLPPMT